MDPEGLGLTVVIGGTGLLVPQRRDTQGLIWAAGQQKQILEQGEVQVLTGLVHKHGV